MDVFRINKTTTKTNNQCSSSFYNVYNIYTYALISGSCQSITMPLRHALIANTVPRHIFPNAYAANVLTIPGTRLLGPFMGGLIITNLGFFWTFALECILGIAVILALITVRARYVDPQIRTCSPMLMGMHRDMVDGLDLHRPYVDAVSIRCCTAMF